MRWIANTGSVDHAIAGVAERQYGVVSRRQLLEVGLSDRAIDARVESGRLHLVFRGVYAVGHRVVGRQGIMLAAVLACDAGTVVSHASAAELLGLWERKPALVNVIGPTQAGRKIDGIRWHRVRLPGRDEITVFEGIPCTSVSRTLVDMAGGLGERSLRRMVEQAAVLRRLDVDAVDRVLSRGRRRGARQLRSILSAWRTADGAIPRLRSLLEARFLPAVVAAGLPRPQLNVRLYVGGRRFEVDLLWEKQRLIVETDGEETHGTSAAFQRDRLRDQVLVAAGYRVARVTWRQMEDEATPTVARIKGMLEVH